MKPWQKKQNNKRKKENANCEVAEQVSTRLPTLRDVVGHEREGSFNSTLCIIAPPRREDLQVQQDLTEPNSQ